MIVNLVICGIVLVKLAKIIVLPLCKASAWPLMALDLVNETVTDLMESET